MQSKSVPRFPICFKEFTDSSELTPRGYSLSKLRDEETL